MPERTDLMGYPRWSGYEPRKYPVLDHLRTPNRVIPDVLIPEIVIFLNIT